MEEDAKEPAATTTQASGAQVIRLRPLRVLTLSPDRRFRAVVELLMTRRGCRASCLGSAGGVAATIVRERVDVVLVDGSELMQELARDVERSDAVAPPVGVVLVGEPARLAPGEPQPLPKWDSFERLFAAVAAAERARARPAPQSALGHDRSPAKLAVALTNELG